MPEYKVKTAKIALKDGEMSIRTESDINAPEVEAEIKKEPTEEEKRKQDNADRQRKFREDMKAQDFKQDYVSPEMRILKKRFGDWDGVQSAFTDLETENKQLKAEVSDLQDQIAKLTKKRRWWLW